MRIKDIIKKYYTKSIKKDEDTPPTGNYNVANIKITKDNRTTPAELYSNTVDPKDPINSTEEDKKQAIEELVNKFVKKYDLILEKDEFESTYTNYILKKDFDKYSELEEEHTNIAPVIGIYPFEDFIRVDVSSKDFHNRAYNEICKPLNRKYKVKYVDNCNSTYVDL